MANAINQINADLFPFANTAEFLYGVNPDYDSTECSIVLTVDHIKEYGKNFTVNGADCFTHALNFCKAVYGDSFDESHPAWNNFAKLTYNQDTLKYFASPRFILSEGQIVLNQGANSKEDNLEFVQTPLKVIENAYKLPQSKVSFKLTSYDQKKMGEADEKKPALLFRANGQLYQINWNMTSDTDYFTFSSVWDDKDLEELAKLTAPLYGASANLKNMFKLLFESKTFPEKGIILKVTNLKIDERETKDKKGKFEVYSYTLDASSLPPIPVIAYSDGQEQITSITECTSLSCFASHAAAIVAKDGSRPTPSNPFYIKVSGVNPKGSDIVPIHQAFKSDKLPAIMQRLIDEQKQPGYFTIPGMPKPKPLQSNPEELRKAAETVTVDSVDFENMDL